MITRTLGTGQLWGEVKAKRLWNSAPAARARAGAPIHRDERATNGRFGVTYLCGWVLEVGGVVGLLGNGCVVEFPGVVGGVVAVPGELGVVGFVGIDGLVEEPGEVGLIG